MGKHGHSGMFKVNLPWPLNGFSWQATLRNRADGDARDALFCSGSEAARGIHGCLAFASGGLGILSTRLCAGGHGIPCVPAGQAAGRRFLLTDFSFMIRILFGAILRCSPVFPCGGRHQKGKDGVFPPERGVFKP